MSVSPSSTPPSFFEQLVGLERDQTPFVLVALVETLGSTPQDAGAKMLVTTDGLHTGTVGGGKVEAKAIALAQALLAARATAPQLVNWALKTEVGMTCGGSVKLYFEPHAGGGAAAAWPIWIFGAGHVVQALVPVLAPLDCQITVCDPRREWLDRLPRARNVRYLQADDPQSLVPSMPGHAFLLCLTKGHASDRPVLQRALSERNFPFVGVIGSAAKAAVLRRELTAAGLSEARSSQFHCPVGLPFGSNRPQEIALSIAAQLLIERDRLGAGANGPAALPESQT
jgi:xanthine dehydrogenase accessory factor